MSAFFVTKVLCFIVQISLKPTNNLLLWSYLMPGILVVITQVTVRISQPPIVESQLQTQRLARGDLLAIVATASGVPQPEFQWRRNGVPVPGANRPMFVRHYVSEIDMGTYTCDVYNVAGSVQWEEMAVMLREDGSDRQL